MIDETDPFADTATAVITAVTATTKATAPKATTKTKTAAPKADKPKTSDKPKAADQPKADDKPKAPLAALPAMTVPHLWGPSVVAGMLHGPIENVLETSLFGSVAPGDYDRMARFCLSAGNKLRAVANQCGPTAEGREISRLAGVCVRLYADGLSEEACLSAYSVLKGGFLVEKYRAEFVQACREAKARLGGATPEGVDTPEECRYSFDLSYAEFRAERDARNANQARFSSR